MIPIGRGEGGYPYTSWLVTYEYIDERGYKLIRALNAKSD
jgi:hypothetical protein